MKLKKIKEKGKLLKGANVKKNQLTYKGEKIRITEDFSFKKEKKDMQARRELN